MNDINTMNLSNIFQNKKLSDPINYNISNNHSLNSQLDSISERYALKSRVIKERDSLGGFKISQESLKKHINPSDEYEARLRLLEEAKEKLYQIEHAPPSIDNASVNYASIIEQSANFDPNAPAADSLLQMIEMQVKQLKAESEYHFNKSQGDCEGLIASNHPQSQVNQVNQVNEKHVANQFLSANTDRVQVIKHVITQLKPEYSSLEDIQKEKEANTLRLLELEKRYKEMKTANPMQEIINAKCEATSRQPGITLEELQAILKHEDDLFHFEAKLRNEKKNKRRTKQVHGEETGSNLNKTQEKYVKKLAKFIIEKKIDEGNETEEKEGSDWNKTRIHSKNVKGVVNRKDGLPGHFDSNDKQMYYCEINNEDYGKVNGIEKAKKRTMRRSYYSDMGMGNEGDGDGLNVSAMELTRTKNVLGLNNNNAKGTMMINMIYDLIDKEKIGLISKEKVLQEMQFDGNIMKDLGFDSRKDFEERLKMEMTEYDGRITQKEFVKFFNRDNDNTMRSMSRSKRAKSMKKSMRNTHNDDEIGYKDMTMTMNKEKPLFYESNNYTMLNPDLDYEPKLNEVDMKSSSNNDQFKYTNRSFNGNNTNTQSQPFIPNEDEDDFLPVFHLRDILKNTSNIKRLQLLKKSLKSINPQSSPQKRPKSSKPTATKPKEVTYSDYKQIITKYSTKDNINFTIPKPFPSQQKGPSQGAIHRMANLLQQRQQEEEDIFINQRFKAKHLKNEMFIGNIDKIIENDKKERTKRTKKLQDELQDSLNPFTFVEKDQKKYLDKVNMKHAVMQYPQFKANNIYWKTKVNMLDKINEKEDKERRERIELHAKETMIKSKLPPRLEQHEKEKEEKKKRLNEIKRNGGQPRESTMKIRPQTAVTTTMIKTKDGIEIPDFARIHKINKENLEKKKKKVKPTVIEAFNLHETHKGYAYDDDDDDNPAFKQNIQAMISKIQKKEVIEPASTAGQKKLIEARRKEQEKKRKEDEMRKIADAQRLVNQTRMKDRVQKSDALNENKGYGKSRMEGSKVLHEKDKERSEYMTIVKQKISNRPLMFEGRNDINALIKRQEMRKIIQEAMEGNDEEDADADGDEDEKEKVIKRKYVNNNDEVEYSYEEDKEIDRKQVKNRKRKNMKKNNEEPENDNNNNNEEEQQMEQEEENQGEDENYVYNDQLEEEQVNNNEEEQENNNEEEQENNNEEEQENNNEEEQENNNEEEQVNNNEEEQVNNNEEEQVNYVYNDQIEEGKNDDNEEEQENQYEEQQQENINEEEQQNEEEENEYNDDLEVDNKTKTNNNTNKKNNRNTNENHRYKPQKETSKENIPDNEEKNNYSGEFENIPNESDAFNK